MQFGISFVKTMMSKLNVRTILSVEHMRELKDTMMSKSGDLYGLFRDGVCEIMPGLDAIVVEQLHTLIATKMYNCRFGEFLNVRSELIALQKRKRTELYINSKGTTRTLLKADARM